MSKTVLEQALDHLLNKEEDKAAALLHDYYVGVGRQVYEDIMADDIAFEDEDAQNATQAVDEVEADLTEEGDDEFAPEMGGEEEATDDLGGDLGGDEAAPVDADSADVADAMMDVESALAKLKAEFEEMVGGDAAGSEEEFGAEEGGEELPAPEEETQESIEEALELQKVSLASNTEGQAAGAGTGYGNGVTGATNTQSPVAKRNPMMARPSTQFGGSTSGEGTASGTTPAKSPKSQDMGGTTRPAVSKVAKPGTAPGREGGSSSNVLPRG
jgi:hypothetical protein